MATINKIKIKYKQGKFLPKMTTGKEVNSFNIQRNPTNYHFPGKLVKRYEQEDRSQKGNARS